MSPVLEPGRSYRRKQVASETALVWSIMCCWAVGLDYQLQLSAGAVVSEMLGTCWKPKFPQVSLCLAAVSLQLSETEADHRNAKGHERNRIGG